MGEVEAEISVVGRPSERRGRLTLRLAGAPDGQQGGAALVMRVVVHDSRAVNETETLAEREFVVQSGGAEVGFSFGQSPPYEYLGDQIRHDL